MGNNNPPTGYNASGYATVYSQKCTDGRTIEPKAFAYLWCGTINTIARTTFSVTVF